MRRLLLLLAIAFSLYPVVCAQNSTDELFFDTLRQDVAKESAKVVDQATNSHRIYAVLVCHGGNFTPILIEETTDPGNAWSGFKAKENFLRDENGKELKFNNILPALGYVESIGWSIPDKELQLYRNLAETLNGRSAFLLYKEVSEPEWLNWIEKGKVKK